MGKKNRNGKIALILMGTLYLLFIECVFAITNEREPLFIKEPFQTLEGHKELVNSVAFSPNGNHIASGSADSTIIIWDPTKKESPLLRILKVQEPEKERKRHVLSVAFSPHDENLLASGSWDTNVYFWNVSSAGTPGERGLTGHLNYVWSVAFSPDGAYLASGSYDNTIKIWDADQDGSKAAIRSIGNGKEEAILCVVYSPSGDYLATGSDDHIIRLWDPQAEGYGPPMWSLVGHKSSILSIAYSPDGLYLASGSEDHNINIWSADFSSPGHAGAGSTSLNTTNNLFQVTELLPHNCVSATKICTPLRTLEGHNGYVMSVAFSPDGAYLASSSYDKTIKIWSTNNYELMATLTGHKGSVRSIAYSPDGQFIVSGSGDRKVMLWKNPYPPTAITITTVITKTTTTTTSSNPSLPLAPSLLETGARKVHHKKKKVTPRHNKKTKSSHKVLSSNVSS